LENDHTTAGEVAEGSDEEYVAGDSEADEVVGFAAKLHQGKGKLRKVNGKRKTRGMLAERQKGPRTFAAILEEVRVDGWLVSRPGPWKYQYFGLTSVGVLISGRNGCAGHC
jgi:hypothetical protein